MVCNMSIYQVVLLLCLSNVAIAAVIPTYTNGVVHRLNVKFTQMGFKSMIKELDNNLCNH